MDVAPWYKVTEQCTQLSSGSKAMRVTVPCPPPPPPWCRRTSCRSRYTGMIRHYQDTCHVNVRWMPDGCAVTLLKPHDSPLQVLTCRRMTTSCRLASLPQTPDQQLGELFCQFLRSVDRICMTALQQARIFLKKINRKMPGIEDHFRFLLLSTIFCC